MFTEQEVAPADQLNSRLPLSAMVRAVCRAALMGPDLLYEAMLKMSLAVEASAPTYGLSIWVLKVDEPPRVEWAEGLNDSEIDEAEKLLTTTLAAKDGSCEIKPGDITICLPLSIPTRGREGLRSSRGARAGREGGDRDGDAGSLEILSPTAH